MHICDMQIHDFAWIRIGKDDWKLATLLPALLMVVAWLITQWLTLGFALEPHWTTSWMILGILLSLLHWSAAITVYSFWAWLSGVVVLTVLFFYGESRSLESMIMHVLLWTILLSRTSANQGILNCMNTLLTVLIVSCSFIFLIYAGWHLSVGTWSHKASYDIPLPWAHRNIAMEALVVAGYAVSQAKKRRTAFMVVLLGVLTTLYQARAAMLVIAMWSLMLALGYGAATKRLRSFLAFAITGLLVLQIVWAAIPVGLRVDLFSGAPDILKSLDVGYNWAQAQSSSERKLIWSWTVENIAAIGPGSGEWKWMAEFEVNNILDKCNVAIRRAHSDLIQTIFELGFVPFVIMALLSYPQLVRQWRTILVMLPIILFSFALERAEVVASMMCMMAIQPESRLASEKKYRAPTSYVISMCCALLVLWAIAQDATGRATRGHALMTDWGKARRMAVDCFPSDIALNHIDVVLASYLHALGQTDRARVMLRNHISENPRSISGIKAWGSLTGNPHNSCDEFKYLQSTFIDDTNQ